MTVPKDDKVGLYLALSIPVIQLGIFFVSMYLGGKITGLY